jgi:uncharacterized membrane protein YciS (DUF1049 family)
MKFASEVSKLLTNKYFLYFMVFLAATNVLGYLVTNKMNAVIFFALVSLLTYQFSKNMAIILLVAVIATNFLMANKLMREGLENNETPALKKIQDIDPQIAETLPVVQQAQNNEQVKTILKKNQANNDLGVVASNEISKNIKKNVSTKIIDQNNIDKNQTTDDEEVEGFGNKMGNKKINNNGSGTRLDYAATIEQSYANLDNLLGSDSIKKLSSDTQKLMAQQQNLFDTMQNMVPVLQGAQNLLKDFKIDGLTDSLKNISGLANAPMPAVSNK